MALARLDAAIAGSRPMNETPSNSFGGWAEAALHEYPPDRSFARDWSRSAPEEIDPEQRNDGDFFGMEPVLPNPPVSQSGTDAR